MGMNDGIKGYVCIEVFEGINDFMQYYFDYCGKIVLRFCKKMHGHMKNQSFKNLSYYTRNMTTHFILVALFFIVI